MGTLKSRDERIGKLRKELTTAEERNQLLEQEVASLKLGSFIDLSENDGKDVRRKLNIYLRELDDVIAKLSSEG